MDVDGLLRRSIAGRNAPVYPPRDSGFLRLDTNTNLIGVNPAAARGAALDLSQYPTALSDALRSELARHHRVSPEQVVVGVGSDEVIDFIVKAFVNPDDAIAIPMPTFVMYEFYGRVNLGRVVEVPLRLPGFTLDLDGLLATRAKVTFVASPNNPTGNAFPAAELERILRESKGIVVVDEAYADFCGQDFAGRIGEFENLIVLRTFSKAHGLAGIRVGYALGRTELVEKLYRVKPAFDVGTLSEAIAVEALRDLSFLRESVDVVRRERARLAQELPMLPSDANFVLLDVGDGAAARRFLYDRKILTRDLGDFPGLERFLRATVGRPEHNDRLIEALAAWKRSR